MPPRSRRTVLRAVGALSAGLAGCQTAPDTGTPSSTESPTGTQTESPAETPTATPDDTPSPTDEPTDEPTPPRPDYRCDAVWNPVQRWRVPTGIRAYEPVVADGVAYFGSQDDRLRAVDVDSGDVRWRREQEVFLYSRPSVVDGGLVVPSYESVVAYGTDGTRQWSFEPPGMHASVDTQVAVAGGVAAVLVTNYAGTMEEPPENPYTRLYAVDLADGTEAWHREFPRDYSPRGLASTGDAVVLASADGEVVAHDPDDGAVAWRAAVDGDLDRGPIAREGLVVVHGSGGLAAVDAPAGTVRWTVRDEFHDSPALGGDAVYCPTRGALVAVDAATGEIRWEAPVDGELSNVSATDDVAYATVAEDDRAAKLALDAGEGCRRGRYETDARDLTRAAVTGDSVLFGGLHGDGAMHAVTRPDT